MFKPKVVWSESCVAVRSSESGLFFSAVVVYVWSGVLLLVGGPPIE